MIVKNCKFGYKSFKLLNHSTIKFKFNMNFSRIPLSTYTTSSIIKYDHHFSSLNHLFQRSYSSQHDDWSKGERSKDDKSKDDKLKELLKDLKTENEPRSEPKEKGKDKRLTEEQDSESHKTDQQQAGDRGSDDEMGKKKRQEKGAKMFGFTVNPDLPLLMHFEPKAMPNIFYTILNYFKVYFYIKPYIDKEFNIHKFLDGSKHALEVVSGRLADGNLDDLKDLVTEEALDEISDSLANFNVNQREQLRMRYNDVLLCYIYSIKINKRLPSYFVEIFVVFDCLRNIKGLMEEQRGKMLSIKEFNKIYIDNKYICNYQFVREYNRDYQTDWLVNKISHIKDKDVLKGLANLISRKK